MKTAIIKFSAGAVALASLLVAAQAFAAAPTEPNCLGNDVMLLAQEARPLGQNVVTNFTDDGFGFEILAHLQGIPAVSTCPDNGFPTPFPLP